MCVLDSEIFMGPEEEEGSSTRASNTQGLGQGFFLVLQRKLSRQFSNRITFLMLPFH